MKKGKLFVVNPVSGGKSKSDFIAFLESHISEEDDIIIWANSKDKNQISEQIRLGGHQSVVAVGGDGTVNLIAGNLLGTNKQLGIIPFGSGNGLARHLGLSMQPAKAFEQLNRASPRPMDVGKVNGQLFCCTCGFSFDAAVAAKFATLKARGLKSYISAGLEIMQEFTPPSFSVVTDNGNSKGNYYILTIANANQYGNNVKIAPHAQIDDGLLELVMIKKPSLPGLMVLVSRLLSNKILSAAQVKHKSIVACKITADTPFAFHLDGEPFEPVRSASAEIVKNALPVLA
jgi:YegS/Rv2252/BmrU family lipid kinase